MPPIGELLLLLRISNGIHTAMSRAYVQLDWLKCRNLVCVFLLTHGAVNEKF